MLISDEQVFLLTDGPPTRLLSVPEGALNYLLSLSDTPQTRLLSSEPEFDSIEGDGPLNCQETTVGEDQEATDDDREAARMLMITT